MPANYSSKRINDTKLFALWDTLPDADFAALGVTRAQLKATQAAMAGMLIFKGDAGYDAARHIFNPVFDGYPGAIALCKTEADVALALKLGQIMPQGFCLRSGGHSTAGYSTTDGLLIDVSALNQITYSATALRVTVGTGVTFGQLYQELDGKGLNVPGGECPDVCIGGFVQGGGYGFTSGMFGLHCDNAVNFRVMLADGSIVQANATTNTDLYWALRGGTGGNFGVVLTVDLTLHKLGPVTGFAMCWPLSTASEVQDAAFAMTSLQHHFAGPAASNTLFTMQTSLCFQNHIDPNQPPPPAGTPLKPYFMIRGMSTLDIPTVKSGLLGLLNAPGCFLQWIKQDSFRNLNEALLNEPQAMPVLDQMPFEDKSSRYIARDLSQSEWAGLLSLFASAPNNMAYGYGELYSGAITGVGVYDTAFVHRDVSLNMVMDVYWLLNADRDKCEGFLRTWNAALAPLSNGEVYQNYPRAADPGYIKSFWRDAYPVLQAVKAKYDAANAFAFPQQVWANPAPGPIADPGVPAAVMTALGQPITAATLGGG